MKTCSHTGCGFVVWGKGYCKNHQYLRTDKKPKTPKQKKSIPKVSKKLASKQRIYSKLRIEFLSRPENTMCAVYPYLRATEIHHMQGRAGELLNDTSTWLAVSRIGHIWIEENPLLAKERGFSMDRLKLTDQLNEN